MNILKTGILLAIPVSIITVFIFRDISSVASLGMYKDYFGVLTNIAAIIFGVVGAWIALIYPKCLSA